MGRWSQPTFKHKCATRVTEKKTAAMSLEGLQYQYKHLLLFHFVPLDFIECCSLGQIGLSLQLTHLAICLCSKFTVKPRVLLFYTNIKSPLTDHDLFVSPQHLDEKCPPSRSNSRTYWLKSYLLGCNGLCYIIISHKTRRFPSHDRCRITSFYITSTVFMR